MRILIISRYYDSHPGGVERVASQLATRLRKRGHEVIWAATDDGGPATPDRLPMQADNLFEDALDISIPLWSFLSWRKLWREAARCDAVHIHDTLYHGSVLGVLAAKYFGKRVIVTQHVPPIPYRDPIRRGLMRGATDLLSRPILRAADQAVFCSSRVRDYFDPAAPVIENGVDPEIFFEAPVPRQGILFVGRFTPKKGLHLLREVIPHFSDTTWTFIGSGRIDPRKWNYPNVRVVSDLPQRELAAFYQRAELLVLPSVGEGYPLVVQEAAACGTPAVYSERPMALEMICEEIRRVRQMAHSHAMISQRALSRWNWDRTVDKYLSMLASFPSTSSEILPSVLSPRA